LDILFSDSFGGFNNSSVDFEDRSTGYVSASICDSNANGSANGILG
jgi:hypothetical protein